MKKTETAVLGKRKVASRCEDLVIHLSPAPTSSTSANQSRPDSGRSSPVPSSSKSPLIIVNGSLVPQTKKCYRCTFAGCEKAYTKPSRLEEHERSHTGQRPFVCETCGKSYLRDTHLHAHARSHLPETSRPLLCDRPGCEKRFWTSQHLNVHYSWHDGAKPYKCSETDCDDAFSKHHLLRAHVCSEHAPPGTKPYRCSHDGCAKSFNTNQHLRTHQKTHDEKRYICVHLNCLATEDGTPRYFQTWSTLQSHLRTEHPPTCSHPSCNGRTFFSQSNLRNHMKIHEECDVELNIDDTLELGNESDRPPNKKRRGGNHDREWKCDFPGCVKDFKSKNAMTTHVNVTHLGKRDFVCHHTRCNRSFGYKHLLQRHLTQVHSPESTGSVNEAEPSLNDDVSGERQILFDIDAITGYAYVQNAETRVKEAKALRCPFPFLQDLTGDGTQADVASGSSRACDYVFSRGYDLRRHLDATHNMSMSKNRVDDWVRQQKAALKSCRDILG